ncbi:MAG: zinc metallopeptidase [Planctomycetia bacterium]|nr:zinc metallopeptidase [Planctomycetia bacterium]
MNDLQYLYFLAPALLLSAWAAWRVKTNFAEGQKVMARCGLTGAEAAERVLKQAGVIATVEEVEGKLSDHYDPRGKVLRLSSEVYEGKSLAALGVACHEAGHAIQDGMNYPFLGIRNLIVPLAGFGSTTGIAMILAGLGLSASEQVLGKWILIAGIAAFSITVLFQLLNLPVEFNATRRGRENLILAGLVGEDEDKVMGKVLEAAAMTYVAATLTSLAQVAYFVVRAMNPKMKTKRIPKVGRTRKKS